MHCTLPRACVKLYQFDFRLSTTYNYALMGEGAKRLGLFSSALAAGELFIAGCAPMPVKTEKPVPHTTTPTTSTLVSPSRDQDILVNCQTGPFTGEGNQISSMNETVIFRANVDPIKFGTTELELTPRPAKGVGDIATYGIKMSRGGSDNFNIEFTGRPYSVIVHRPQIDFIVDGIQTGNSIDTHVKAVCIDHPPIS